MPRKNNNTTRKRNPSGGGQFRIEFKNEAQGLAWSAFQQHDVLFLIGPAGTGKSFLACAFAIEQILAKQRSRIVLTRPIVESGESLGFLQVVASPLTRSSYHAEQVRELMKLDPR